MPLLFQASLARVKSSQRTAKRSQKSLRSGPALVSAAEERRREQQLLSNLLDTVELVQFLATSIASIPFDTCDEPLHLV